MNRRNRNAESVTANCRAWNSKGFTLIELLVVISIIGVLASLVVGISGAASARKKISATQGKLKQLELAIENYKAAIGGYPPDARFADGTVNTVTNQLYYELTGSVFRDGVYVSNQGGERLNQTLCRNVFGVKGFQNVARDSDKSRSFLELGKKDFRALTAGSGGNINLLTAPVPWGRNPLAGRDSRGRNLEDYRPIKVNDPTLTLLNPWQYRSSGRDRFNQASFDLWADVPIGQKIYRISNWSTEPKVIARAD